MSVAAHTPGPWTFTNGQLLRICASGREAGWKAPVVVCGVHRLGRLLGAERADESAANARLIAAAPELLEVARLVLSIDDEWRALSMDERSRVEAAIAKAEASS